MRRSMGVAALALLAATGTGRAQDKPAALVDTISIQLPGVATMDYLPAGKEIDLGADGRLVIDYLASCIREEITGGIVRIGAQQSTVEKGKVSRKRVECDGAELQLTALQADRGGTVVYRSAMNKGPDGLPLPDLVLHSRAPFVITSQTGTIRIERLDAQEPPIEVTASAQGRSGIDLGSTGTLLTAGGLYKAGLGEKALVFRVSPDAGGAEVARLSRMLPL